MREYELVLVVSPEGGEEGFPATLDRVHSLIKERGGEVKNVDRWGRRRLAYPLDRFTEGYYSITQFTLGPDKVRELEGSLGRADDILRHLVVRMEEPIVVRPELDPDAPVEAVPEEAAAPSAEETPEAPAEEAAAEGEEPGTEAPGEATTDVPEKAPSDEGEPEEEPVEAGTDK